MSHEHLRSVFAAGLMLIASACGREETEATTEPAAEAPVAPAEEQEPEPAQPKTPQRECVTVERWGTGPADERLAFTFERPAGWDVDVVGGGATVAFDVETETEQGEEVVLHFTQTAPVDDPSQQLETWKSRENAQSAFELDLGDDSIEVIRRPLAGRQRLQFMVPAEEGAVPVEAKVSRVPDGCEQQASEILERIVRSVGSHT